MSQTLTCSVVVLACALGGVGCSVVLDYPALATESGIEACSSPLDEDLDGLLNCADPDCVGSCPEWSADACGNGRDDDGDGLTDVDDPECWPHTDVEVDRTCMRVDGSTLTSTDWASLSLTVSPDVDVVDDSSGRVVTFPGERAGFVLADELVTGDLRDARIEMDLDVVPGRWFEVGLLVQGGEAGLRAGSADGIGALVFPTDSGVGIFAATVGGGRPAVSLVGSTSTQRVITAPESLHVVLRTRADLVGQVVVDTIEVGGETYEIRGTADRTYGYVSPDVGMRLYARAEAAAPGDDVAIRSISVERAPIDRCSGRPSASQPVLEHRVLAAVELDDGHLCALVATSAPEWAGSEITRMRSTLPCGDGPWEVVGAPLSGLTNVSTAALAHTADGRLIALIGSAHAQRLAVNELDTLTFTTEVGADCEGAWALTADAIDVPSATLVGALGMNVSQERRAGVVGLFVDDTGLRHVTVVDRDDATPVDIVLRGTEPVGAPVVTNLEPKDLGAILGLGIQWLAGNRIWSSRVQSGEVALILSGEGGLTGRASLLTPGLPPGAFDEAGGAFPTFVPFAPGDVCAVDDVRGVLFEGALSPDPTDSRYRTGVFPVHIRQR